MSGDKQSFDFREMRFRMLDEQVIRRGIKSARVIKALQLIPRQKFVPEKLIAESYNDCPLPIGFQQTISQPYIVALMSEILAIESHHDILEIGTGSGYQTAILAMLGRSVTSVEIIPELHAIAKQVLQTLELDNIQLFCGDACSVLSKHLKFNRIIVTAAAENIPRHLLELLKNNGKMVIPIGKNDQKLKMAVRHGGKIEIYNGPGVRFVPITGKNFKK